MKLRLFISALCFLLCSCSEEPDNWNNTLEKISSGIVNIQYDTPVYFDGKRNASSQATGFVVDAKRGIILTNRHVVTPGPTTPVAVFANSEEVDLVPLYFDPVHDFGFFSYKPEELTDYTPYQLSLNPDAIKVGQEIRIIGNDAGQKLSILDGTISRLDRNAPNYGESAYNDFNTFYIQATTASTGGSSGSPVIDIKGNVVALNAGSRRNSSTAFYLPLEQVEVALARIQNGETVNRGTIQTTFKHTAFPELERLGLSDEKIAQYKLNHPDASGLLVVSQIIPQSPASQFLEVGDILLNIEQSEITHFLEYERLINNHIGSTIDLRILRHGNVFEGSVLVDNLTAFNPVKLFQFDDSTFHTLSYQQARHFHRPVSGVYVANAASEFAKAGLKSGNLIVSVDGVPIANIDDFQTEIENKPYGAEMSIRFFSIKDPKETFLATVRKDGKWFTKRECSKNTNDGLWLCDNLNGNNPVSPHSAAGPHNIQFSYDKAYPISETLVKVQFFRPFSIMGTAGGGHSSGTGIIVDKEKGWVVVDKSTVSSMLGDVEVIFNNRLKVQGNVVYIHPLHNLAIVSYPTDQINSDLINEARISTTPPKLGQTVTQVGLDYDGSFEFRETYVETNYELWLNRFNVPQFIDQNIDVIHIADANYDFDGALIDEKNEVIGFWASFKHADDEGKGQTFSAAGIPAELINETIALAKSQGALHSLNLSLTYIAPFEALQLGIPDEWLNRILAADENTQKVVYVANVPYQRAPLTGVKRGDIILAINDTPVSTFRAVETLSQAPQVNVSVLREKEVMTVEVSTSTLNGIDIDRVLYWSGMRLHEPHRMALLQRGIEKTGVYSASYQYGSPAERFGLYATNRIVEIDGQPVNTLDDFIALVKDRRHRESLTLTMINLNNKPKVKTMKLDYRYWPFYEMKYNDGVWTKVNYPLDL